ncbi:MAG TPA: GNAT family N-acetyltransferase [Egicoccus sp.]|nr:GNAT family N-acetyltransferase [Egicoccus sp.]HSK21604.1 GNAT family N-acetyltransferase [Egicoccus sp.]
MPAPAGYRLDEIASNGFDDDPLLARRGQRFRERLGGPHRLFRYTDEHGTTAAYAWLTEGPATAPLGSHVRLRVPEGIAYVWDCRTADDHRGRGLYTALVAGLAAGAAEHGSGTAMICCDPDNEASRRGILAAGFGPWQTVDVYRLGPLHAVRRGGRWKIQPSEVDLFDG